MSETESRYFRWLCDQVKCLSTSDVEDCAQLHRHDFYAMLPDDLNRALDGLVLRENYKYETRLVPDISVDRPCTVFEVMIALARRMRFTMEDSMDPTQNTDHRWFFEMMDNIEKPRRRRDWDGYRWDDAVEKILERGYGYSGDGGLFPRATALEDQRLVDLWSQANGYLMDWYE